MLDFNHLLILLQVFITVLLFLCGIIIGFVLRKIDSIEKRQINHIANFERHCKLFGSNEKCEKSES